MSEAAVAELESQSQVADGTVEVQPEDDGDDEVADGKSYLDKLTERRAARQPKTEDSSSKLEPTTPLLDPRAVQYIQDYRNLAQTRQGAIEEIVGGLEEFVPPQILKATRNELKGILNAHHSDGLRLSGYEAAATAVNYEQSHIQDAIASVLAPTQLKKLADRMQAQIQANGVATYQDTFKNIVSLARDGYVAQETYSKDVAKAYDDGLKGRQKREGQADKSNAAAGRLTASPAPTYSGKKPTNIDEARSLHSRGLISNGEMASYKTQFK